MMTWLLNGHPCTPDPVLRLSELAPRCPETTDEDLNSWRARLGAAGVIFQASAAGLALVTPDGWLTEERLDWCARHEGDLVEIVRMVTL